MKHVLRLTSFLSLIASTSPFAQDTCDAKLLNYAAGHQQSAKTYYLQIHSVSGGSLHYFGALHLSDPTDQQFNAIKKLWEESKPTIAFYEGPDRGIADSDTASIRHLGESGYLRFLAKSAGIRTLSLEPSPQDLFQYLITKQDQEKVEMFFLLNEAMRLRTRRDFTKEQIESALTAMIEKVKLITGNSSLITSISMLQTSFVKYWGNTIPWWKAPKEWFDPQKNAEETGGIFTNEINRLSSSFRDLYMYRLLARHTNNGERVIAVVGRDHVPAQAAALQCAVQ